MLTLLLLLNNSKEIFSKLISNNSILLLFSLIPIIEKEFISLLLFNFIIFVIFIFEFTNFFNNLFFVEI